MILNHKSNSFTDSPSDYHAFENGIQIGNTFWLLTPRDKAFQVLDYSIQATLSSSSKTNACFSK